MRFAAAVKSAFGRVLDYSTRSSASEFGYFILFFFLTGTLVTIIEAFALPGANGTVHIELFFSGDNGPLSRVYSWLMLVVFVPLCVRRLHDVNISGWFVLLLLVPVVNLIAVLLGIGVKGSAGDNRFGPDPGSQMHELH